jgi:hypothetical protein
LISAWFDLGKQVVGKLSYSYALNLLVAFYEEVKENQKLVNRFTKGSRPDTKEGAGSEVIENPAIESLSAKRRTTKSHRRPGYPGGTRGGRGPFETI